jgi:hypothetical protein
MKWRTILGFAWVLAVGAILAPPAASQQVCLQLESQLAALERQDNQAAYQAVLAQYQRAQANYDAAYRQADAMGCIPRLFRLQVPAACTATRAQLDAQLSELTRLQQQLQSFNPNQSMSARNSLLQALAANNCGPQYAPYATPAVGGRLLDRLFGPAQNGPVGNMVPLVITYRTVCVRGCDDQLLDDSRPIPRRPADMPGPVSGSDAVLLREPWSAGRNRSLDQRGALHPTAERICVSRVISPRMRLPADDADRG